jgi:two-component system KDP operon response regulator KdpE
MAPRVLIVDDENAIRRVLCTTLRASGFDVVESARGEEAVSLVNQSTFDAVLLDRNMPGMGGLNVCRAIRLTNRDVPILMLTVRDAEDDKVEALDAGCDDYVTKPFAVRELIARVNALVRRMRKPEPVGTIIHIHDVSLCGAQRSFVKRGELLHLTRTQFDIVELLMRAPGQAVSHKKILSSIWGPEYREHVEYLRTFMRQLRKIIEDDPSRPQYLLTVPYFGYRFRSAESRADRTEMGDSTDDNTSAEAVRAEIHEVLLECEDCLKAKPFEPCLRHGNGRHDAGAVHVGFA